MSGERAARRREATHPSLSVAADQASGHILYVRIRQRDPVAKPATARRARPKKTCRSSRGWYFWRFHTTYGTSVGDLRVRFVVEL
eukprot:scaffold96843_cov42-Phaeocystis_antarctica.AAC.1